MLSKPTTFIFSAKLRVILEINPHFFLSCCCSCCCGTAHEASSHAILQHLVRLFVVVVVDHMLCFGSGVFDSNTSKRFGFCCCWLLFFLFALFGSDLLSSTSSTCRQMNRPQLLVSWCVMRGVTHCHLFPPAFTHSCSLVVRLWSCFDGPKQGFVVTHKVKNTKNKTNCCCFAH